MPDNVVRLRPRLDGIERDAAWRINEDDERLSLQIELGNDHAVTLTLWKNGDPPRVALWEGRGEHSFVKTSCERGETLEYFREWLEGAAQRKSAHA